MKWFTDLPTATQVALIIAVTLVIIFTMGAMVVDNANMVNAR